MYNEKLEALITAALADGVLTDKEKKVLFKKAEAMGIDHDEFELVLDGRLAKRKKEMEAQAPQAAKPAQKKGGIPQELDDLIQEYLTDGIISAKERQVLLNKAQSLGLNVDEVDLYIDAQQQKADQAVAAAMNKRRGKTCPYCGSSIPELTDKCPNCGNNITPEASKELEEIIDHLETALVNFKSGEDVEKSKAEVERYVRKARLYYGNNPKVQHLLEEVEMESEAAEEEARKNAKYRLVNRYKWYILGALIIVIAGAYYLVSNFIENNKPENNANKTTELVQEAVQQGDFVEAKRLMDTYNDKHTNGISNYNEVTLGKANEIIKTGYLEKGDYAEYVEQCRYFGYDENTTYDAICKCLDKMKQNGDKEKMRSFINSQAERYFNDNESALKEEEWMRRQVRKRLYKYAGL